MITLNITIGGNLLIELNKNSKEELKELIEKASNTDAILTDLLESSGYLKDGYYGAIVPPNEIPTIGYSVILNEDGEPSGWKNMWQYKETDFFAEKLLKNKKVLFKKA